MQAVLDSGCLPRLVELLSSDTDAIVTPPLRTIGNFVTGNDQQQTRLVIRSEGLLASMEKLMKRPLHQKAVCFAVSNAVAVAGNSHFILDTSSIFSDALQLLRSDDTPKPVMKDAVDVISYATYCGESANVVKRLVALGAIPTLCGLLKEHHDRDLTTEALDALDNIICVGDRDRRENVMIGCCNEFVKEIVNGGLYPLIEAVSEREGQDDIHDHAFMMLETHFNDTVLSAFRDTRWTWELHTTFPTETRFAVCAVFEGLTIRDSKGDVQFLPGEVAYQICSFLGEKRYNLLVSS